MATSDGSNEQSTKKPSKDPDSSRKIAEIVNAANTINQFSGPIREGSRFRDFSDRDFKPWNSGELAGHKDSAIRTDEEIEVLRRKLEKRRLLLVVGEEDVGKGFLVLLTAGHIIESGPTAPHRALVVKRALSADVSVRVDHLTTSGVWSESVVVIQDAFASRNMDLMQLVKEMNEGDLNKLDRQLRDAGSFLILTSDRSLVPGADTLSRLIGFEVVYEVENLSPEYLLLGLRRRAERLAQQRGGSELRRKVAENLNEHGSRIVGELRSVRDVCSFIDVGLFSWMQGQWQLEEALEKSKSLILLDLQEENDAWSFVLSLVLAQSLPGSDGVSLHAFFSLWREVARHTRLLLRSRLQAHGVQLSGVNESFLKRVRAEVNRTPEGGCVVRFKDSVDVGRLWQTLLGPGRFWASSMIALLRRLAEESDFPAWDLAARALGRLGILDPARIVFPLVANWSLRQGAVHPWHIALGQLFHGIFGAGDTAYQERCLGYFRGFALSVSGEAVNPGVIALREIGLIDLDLALRELVGFLRRELQEYLTGAGTEMREALLFFDSERYALAAVEHSLTSLCFCRGPIRVLAELKGLLMEEEEGLTPILTLLFLKKGGVADELSVHKAPIAVEDSHWIWSNDFIASLAFGGESRERLCDILAAVYTGSNAFRGWLSQPFRERLGIILKSWARDAVQLPETMNTCAELFADLLASKEQGLAELVFDMLKHDPDFTKEGSKLSELARNSRIRRVSGR